MEVFECYMSEHLEMCQAVISLKVELYYCETFVLSLSEIEIVFTLCSHKWFHECVDKLANM